MRMCRIERSRLPYLPLLWLVRQSGAAVEHNDVIVTLGLLSKQHITQTPISHVFLDYTFGYFVKLSSSERFVEKPPIYLYLTFEFFPLSHRIILKIIGFQYLYQIELVHICSAAWREKPVTLKSLIAYNFHHLSQKDDNAHAKCN